MGREDQPTFNEKTSPHLMGRELDSTSYGDMAEESVRWEILFFCGSHL
jgi:hypothetical protein